MQAIYGQCLNDHLMLGGYGVVSTDSVTNHKVFSNLNYLSTFIHLYTKNQKFNYSLFGGYSKNLGSKKPIAGEVYARDPKIMEVWRLSPVLSYTWKWIVSAAELEYTYARWGSPDKYYSFAETGNAGNWRFTLQFVYNF